MGVESKKKFTVEKKSEPLTFLVWLFNTLHNALNNGELTKQSIITNTFQGEIKSCTEDGDHVCDIKRTNRETTYSTDNTLNIPYIILSLDLPLKTQMFKDAFGRIQMSQFPLSQLLKKYDGQSIHENSKPGYNRYSIIRLPKFLILYIRRFTNNGFFWEKNSSIVNFPVKNLDFKDIIPLPTQQALTKYDLIATISHEGSVGEGTYKIYVHRKIEDIWYEVQDLTVVEVLPQMVALSETYLLMYEQK